MPISTPSPLPASGQVFEWVLVGQLAYLVEQDFSPPGPQLRIAPFPANQLESGDILEERNMAGDVLAE
jgi:hypothetical protein